MASNNLRILYNNLLLSANISASSAASSVTQVTNMLNEYKSSVWRSGTKSNGGAKATLIIDLGINRELNALILGFTNLTSTSTLRVRGWDGAGSVPSHTGTINEPTLGVATCILNYDSGIVISAPWATLGNWYWGASSLGENAYTGRKSYARVFMNSFVASRYITIEIEDTSISTGYIEVGYALIGTTWSPKYNTGYGLSAQFNDESEHKRTEAGDLLTIYSPGYNSLNFDLKWMDPADRSEALRLFTTAGKYKPIFVSLFPDNSEDWGKEQTYQIIGKLKNTSAITHPVLAMYSTQMQIEEL